MADGNHLKLDDQVDVADDDPFAELTRIMGFDPRQSVREADAKAAAEKSVAGSIAAAADSEARSSHAPGSTDGADVDDDFSINLEKELMGEFSFDDEDFVSTADAEHDDEPEASDSVQDAPLALDEQHAEKRSRFRFRL